MTVMANHQAFRRMSSMPMPRPTVSVAMTTFCGARFLPEQLASIAAQSVRPDELVIGDDQSTDATADLIAQFAADCPWLELRFERNVDRLGSSRNFESVARRCRGDIVLFSDQDDIWLPQRVEASLQALQRERDSLYVFADGQFIDEFGRDLPGTLFSSLSFGYRERDRYMHGDALRVLLQRNVVTGATLAVRRAALLAVMPFEEGWVHDYYLALMLELRGRGTIIDTPMIRYRLHSTQQVGLAPRATLTAAMGYARKQDEAHCRRDATNYERLARRLRDAGIESERWFVDELHAKSAFCLQRAAMRAHPVHAPAAMARLLRSGAYTRYSSGWKQWAVDLLSIGQRVRKRLSD